jgi:hypothetical protein
MNDRCSCGFPRDACWRCSPPPDYPDDWLDAMRDMEEDKAKDKGQSQPQLQGPNDDQ